MLLKSIISFMVISLRDPTTYADTFSWWMIVPLIALFPSHCFPASHTNSWNGRLGSRILNSTAIIFYPINMLTRLEILWGRERKMERLCNSEYRLPLFFFHHLLLLFLWLSATYLAHCFQIAIYLAINYVSCYFSAIRTPLCHLPLLARDWIFLFARHNKQNLPYFVISSYHLS